MCSLSTFYCQIKQFITNANHTLDSWINQCVRFDQERQKVHSDTQRTKWGHVLHVYRNATRVRHVSDVTSCWVTQRLTFNLGVGEVRVHLHRLEHLDDLLESLHERVELSEDVHLGELELPLVRHLLQARLRLSGEHSTAATIDRCTYDRVVILYALCAYGINSEQKVRLLTR